MITTLNLNRHRKARIWLGELPNWINQDYPVINRSYNGSHAREVQNIQEFVRGAMLAPDWGISSNREPLYPVRSLPSPFVVPSPFVERVFNLCLPESTSDFAPLQQGAIEMIIPSGGRALYGLLGGGFLPDRSGELVVKVAVSKKDELEMPESLASKFDTVYRGLPGEYADSVFDGIGDAGEILGSGLLLCNCAAHSPVGSSPWMFRQLALIWVRLIASQTESVSEEELTRLVSIE